LFAAQTESTPSPSSAQLEAEIQAIEAELQARRYAVAPDEWARDILNHHIWSIQRRILLALKQHRKVAVRSCHGAGKSFIAGVACGHWIDTNPPGQAFIVTSAPTGPQVRAILWREIGRVHSRGKLPGRVNQTEWFIPVDDREELVGFGRKPSDYSPDAFQGIHAPKVLVLFDEANGIPEVLWDAADSLTANDDSRMLVIGNPDDPASYFATICKPNTGWHVIEISAFATPNFTGEEVPVDVGKQLIGHLYVEEKRKKWASNWRWTDDKTRCVPPEGMSDTDTHPYWQSKVLGRFPAIPEDPGLIPEHWIQAAKERKLSAVGTHNIGVDVGGGGDSSCGCGRKGNVFRILWEDRNPDTMHTTGMVIKHLHSTHSTHAFIDMIGIGRGVRDRGLEQNYRFIGVNVGQAPLEDSLDPANEHVEYTNEVREDERFANLRAQLWWHVRTKFERGTIDIDPEDEELAEQLVSIRFKRRSDGRIIIESKDDAKRRGVVSPNRADALMLACAPEALDDALHGKATW
jgi:hypothetical protein